MLTEIQLNPDEFDYFQVGVDSEVTFCLKELRVKQAFVLKNKTFPLNLHDLTRTLQDGPCRRALGGVPPGLLTSSSISPAG